MNPIDTQPDALLPCPFCGEAKDLTIYVYGSGEDDAYVQCRECTTCGPDGGDRAGAIAKWNHRAELDRLRQAQVGEAVATLLDEQRRANWGRLYTAANAVVAKVGYQGTITSDSSEIHLLMNSLHDIDGGQWCPGLQPNKNTSPPLQADACRVPQEGKNVLTVFDAWWEEHCKFHDVNTLDKKSVAWAGFLRAFLLSASPAAPTQEPK